MKKFLVILAAFAAIATLGGTASAQCGSAYYGSPVYGGYYSSPVYYSTPYYGYGYGYSSSYYGGYYSSPVYYSTPVYNGCSSGNVYQGQTQTKTQTQTQPKKAVMPQPDFQPYKGESPPTQAPKEVPLPPKQVQPPNPLQEGFPTRYFDGDSYGRLPDGSYARISDGTYSRLIANR